MQSVGASGGQYVPPGMMYGVLDLDRGRSTLSSCQHSHAMTSPCFLVLMLPRRQEASVLHQGGPEVRGD